MIHTERKGILLLDCELASQWGAGWWSSFGATETFILFPFSFFIFIFSPAVLPHIKCMYLNFVYIIHTMQWMLTQSSFSVVHQSCMQFIHFAVWRGEISREMNTFTRILHLCIDEIVAIQPVVGVTLILFFSFCFPSKKYKKIVS